MKTTKSNEVVDATKMIVLGVRFSASELAEIRACADATGHKMSTWVRWVAVREADAQAQARAEQKRRKRR